MSRINRRGFLSSSVAAPLLAQSAAPRGGIYLSMHEATSGGFDFRTAMEGYAKAGVRAVEITLPRLREFAQKEIAPHAEKTPPPVSGAIVPGEGVSSSGKRRSKS